MSVPDQALPQTSQVTGPIGAGLRGGGDATDAQDSGRARHPRITHAVSPCVHDERRSPSIVLTRERTRRPPGPQSDDHRRSDSPCRTDRPHATTT